MNRSLNRTLICLALFAALALAACGGPAAVGQMRFKNQAIVWRVNDRIDTPEKPDDNPFPEKLYFLDGVFVRRVTRLMELPDPQRATSVNALDEVPDSTWFTNRIGVRDLSLDEIRKGPNAFIDGPDASLPWKVTGSKVGGGSVGFVIEDARGDKYIVKFDEPAYPVMETATDVAVQRLLWACGYNVPENSIVYFRRSDLVMAPDANIKDVFGNKTPMTDRDLDAMLSKVNRRKDGTYRALASKYLAGIPLGGFPQKGVRAGDPNDTIPHQLRREIRGLYTIFGWVQQTDAKEDNTLDMWIEDSGKHHVLHYLVDFGKSFGTSAFIVKRPGDGHVENVDFEYIFWGSLTLGFWKRPFEGTPKVPIEGVGMFDSDHFEPGDWKSHVAYAPFVSADPFDQYWAAKIIVRFSPAQIRAALEQGKFEDPRAIDYLTETLIARQRLAARHWFSQVNPLDHFEIVRDGGTDRLCFDDLLVTHQLSYGARANSRYRATAFDFAGQPLGWSVEAAADPTARHTACASGFEPGQIQNGYTIISLTTLRGGQELAPVEVHLAPDPKRVLRIIGINRR